MINLDIAAARGLTVERLKAIATATPPENDNPSPRRRFIKPGESPLQPAEVTSAIYKLPENPTDWDLRQYLESLIEARMTEGWQRSFDSFRLYAPVDIGMDATPINRTNFPLVMLGQGHINLDTCERQISQLSPELANQLFQKNQDGKPFKVNWPKFTEISYNLLHSLVTRRVAAVATPIATRYPFLRYDSRSTGMVGKLRGELMTNKAEVMSDSYGYRHDIVQSVRDATCYTHQIEFCSASWSKDPQPAYVAKPKDGTTGVGPESTDRVIEDVVVREGVEFVAPHPTRCFWDLAKPLAKLNFDCGPTYIGYWDVIRAGDIRANTDFYNRDAIEINPSAYEFLASNNAYFKVYYPDTIVFPTKDNLGNAYSMGNDRVSNIGYYAQLNDDVSVTTGNVFFKINPKKLGICDYNGEVWIRFMVGGTRTIMYAEPMPSMPGCVYHYNENDGRLNSPSFAHAVMPFQDQISNLLSQLLEIQLQGLTKIYELNKDGMEEADIKNFEDSIRQKQYYSATAIILKYSAEALKDMGVNPQQVARVRAVEIQTAEKTSEIFRSITQLLAFSERLLFFSPQELGQVAPRETTATEAQLVNNTTLGIRDFHTIGIEEGLGAKKRIIYEASIACGSDEVTLTAQDRFSRSVVEKAGFKVVETDGDPDTTEVATDGRFTLTGDKTSLVHDYIFTSRDGLERPSSQAVAAVLTQLLQVLSTPSLGRVLTLEKLVELINEISRNMGAGFDLRAAVPKGMDGSQPLVGDPMKEFEANLQQIISAVQSLSAKQQQDSSALKELAGAVERLSLSISASRQAPLPPVPDTMRGQISPEFPIGSGAPPLNLIAPMEVGALPPE